ncbi:hypothetical protein [Parafrankia elaeagni]|uniref:hypothetical protein n=1 Tax=Parafrankia elaeagni TaxID=222534 RepID=UPI0003A86D99|nr:hypothetical protein [Parafrankia elaeagni]
MTPGSPGWLRIAATEAGQQITTFWDGGRTAQQALPASIPRPALRAIHDHHHDGWDYRAELYDRVHARPLAATTVPRRLTGSPKRHWFQALRRSLCILATVSTDRRTIEQSYLDDVMPRMLGEPITTAAPAPWVTAHGDLHWANLCGPTLRVLDWEGWGLAPAGYDAATLHCHSLLIPTLAAQVRANFADVLSAETGRCAELAVIAEQLDAVHPGSSFDHTWLLRARATHLLGRPLPRRRAALKVSRVPL